MAEDGDSSIIVAVTFGRCSFVGRSLVAALLSDRRFTVRVIDPLPAPDPTPSLSPIFQSGRVSYHHVDIRHQSPSISTAFSGVDAVFHVDPTLTTIQPLSERSFDFVEHHFILIRSTRNMISACLECGVQRVVYVGSADAVVGGANEACLLDESAVYPERFLDGLSELRAQAEALVLMSNGKNGLSTCALRVSSPFGPGADNLVPLFVEGAKEGWTNFIIGSGKNLWDFTYIENAAHAAICAEQALRMRIPYVAGRPFFITNQEPMKFWDFVSCILDGLGYQRPSVHLPANIVLSLANIARFFHEKFLLYKTSNPFFTACTIRSFTGTRTFDSSNAERILGYSPIISLEDGITLTIASFSQLANGSSGVELQDLTRPSKVEKLLGNGNVANILLWQDDRRTFLCLISLFLLHYWFFLSERTLISSAAKLLILFTIILFFYGFLPSSLLDSSYLNMSLQSLEVSELTVRNFFGIIASLWNQCICMLKTVAQGEDWGVLLKVVGFFTLLKLLLLFSISAISAAGLVCLFTFFIVYEQCEREIESLMAAGARNFGKMKSILIAKLPYSMTKLAL